MSEGKLEITEKGILLKTTYDYYQQHKQYFESFKKYLKMRWLPQGKKWFIPRQYTITAYHFLKSNFDKLIDIFPQITTFIIQDIKTKLEKAEKIIKETFAVFGLKPRKYQILASKEAILRLNEYKKSGLFLPTGAGKTITSLAIYRAMKRFFGVDGKLMVVAPNSLLKYWEKHVERLEEDAYVLPYSESAKRKEENKVKIEEKVGFLILDESHYIKNHRTKRAKWLREIVYQYDPYTLFMTATPTPNGWLEEIWYLSPRAWHYFKIKGRIFLDMLVRDFDARLYEETVYTKQRDPFGDIKTITKKHVVDGNPQKMSLYAIFLKEEDIQAELPDYQIIEFPFDFSDFDFEEAKRRYIEENGEPSGEDDEQYWSGFLFKWLHWVEEDFASQLVERDTKDLVEMFRKFVFFFKHNDVGEMLRRAFEKKAKAPVYYVDGKVPIDKRQEIIERFNEAKEGVLILQRDVGGVGLDIWGCNIGLMLIYPWTHDDLMQLIGRMRRLKSTHKVVNFFLPKSYDLNRKIAELIEGKKKRNEVWEELKKYVMMRWGK